MADQILEPNVTPFYLDKALWATVLAPVLVVLNAKLGLGLKSEEVVGMLLPIVSYVVMHKWKTAQLALADKNAAVAVAAARGKDPAEDLAVK